jgi:TonB family protein
LIRAIRGALCVGIAINASLPSAVARPAQRQVAVRDYDIPAQDIETALLTLGRQSGIDILYERDALAGLRSAPVRGELTPQAAVARMLANAPLIHRFTSATAVLILPARGTHPAASAGNPAAAATPRLVLDRLQVRAERVVGQQPGPDYRPFGLLVRSTIARRLQDDPRTRGRAFNVRLAVAMDPQGVIRDPIVRRSSGTERLDRAIVLVVSGTTLPEPPPTGMPQPIWLEIVAR